MSALLITSLVLIFANCILEVIQTNPYDWVALMYGIENFLPILMYNKLQMIIYEASGSKKLKLGIHPIFWQPLLFIQLLDLQF